MAIRNLPNLMSALVPKMSALTPIADIHPLFENVRFGPIADIQERVWNVRYGPEANVGRCAS
jgi:hypothetical protein